MHETICHVVTIVCSAITCIIFVLMLIPPRHRYPTAEETAAFMAHEGPRWYIAGVEVSEDEYRAVTGGVE